MRKYESHGFFADPCDVCTITCIYMNVTFAAHCAQVISVQASFVAFSAMASQPVTLQVEALSMVHNRYADEEKKDLKRKLEATQIALAASEQELTTVRDDLAEARDIISVFEELAEEAHTRSRKKMHQVLTKLMKCQETGNLSTEEVGEMIDNLESAYDGLDDLE